MKNRGNPRWPGVVGCFLATFLLAGSGAAYVLSYANKRSNVSRSVSNCWRLLTALRMYASDHDGKYPDSVLPMAGTSNEVLRALIKDGMIADEMIFGSFASPFRPDGDIGSEPEYRKALEAGENHWAMTAGLSESMPGEIPALYENPAEATWPPKWNASAKGSAVRGRAWPSGVIVGRKDWSVSCYPLESRSGTAVGLKKGDHGRDLFEAAIDPVTFPKGVVLDVLVKE